MSNASKTQALTTAQLRNPLLKALVLLQMLKQAKTLDFSLDEHKGPKAFLADFKHLLLHAPQELGLETYPMLSKFFVTLGRNFEQELANLGKITCEPQLKHKEERTRVKTFQIPTHLLHGVPVSDTPPKVQVEDKLYDAAATTEYEEILYSILLPALDASPEAVLYARQLDAQESQAKAQRQAVRQLQEAGDYVAAAELAVKYVSSEKQNLGKAQPELDDFELDLDAITRQLEQKNSGLSVQARNALNLLRQQAHPEPEDLASYQEKFAEVYTEDGFAQAYADGYTEDFSSVDDEHYAGAPEASSQAASKDSSKLLPKSESHKSTPNKSSQTDLTTAATQEVPEANGQDQTSHSAAASHNAAASRSEESNQQDFLDEQLQVTLADTTQLYALRTNGVPQAREVQVLHRGIKRFGLGSLNSAIVSNALKNETAPTLNQDFDKTATRVVTQAEMLQLVTRTHAEISALTTTRTSRSSEVVVGDLGYNPLTELTYNRKRVAQERQALKATPRLNKVLRTNIELLRQEVKKYVNSVGRARVRMARLKEQLDAQFALVYSRHAYKSVLAGLYWARQVAPAVFGQEVLRQEVLGQEVLGQEKSGAVAEKTKSKAAAKSATKASSPSHPTLAQTYPEFLAHFGYVQGEGDWSTKLYDFLVQVGLHTVLTQGLSVSASHTASANSVLQAQATAKTEAEAKAESPTHPLVVNSLSSDYYQSVQNFLQLPTAVSLYDPNAHLGQTGMSLLQSLKLTQSPTQKATRSYLEPVLALSPQQRAKVVALGDRADEYALLEAYLAFAHNQQQLLLEGSAGDLPYELETFTPNLVVTIADYLNGLSDEQSNHLEANPRLTNYTENAIPNRSFIDTSLVLDAYTRLAPGGIAVIMVQNSMLERNGNEVEMRQRLIDDNAIRAVIGLPANLSQLIGAEYQWSALVLEKSRQAATQDTPKRPICFAQLASLESTEIDNLLSSLSAGVAKAKNLCYVDAETIRIANLVPFTYLDLTKPDLVELEDISALETKVSRAQEVLKDISVLTDIAFSNIKHWINDCA